MEYNKELIEKVADLKHDRWSRWMRYQFSQGKTRWDGGWLMPKEFVKRWTRQMNTSYNELSEAEKDSDRKEAQRTLDILREYGINL